MDTSKNYTIFEYKMLREEMMYLMKMVRIYQYIAITIIISFLSFYKPKYEYSISISMIIIFFNTVICMISLHIKNNIIMITKISAYMEEFLEPKLYGISWETNTLLFSKINGDYKDQNIYLKVTKFMYKNILDLALIFISLYFIYDAYNYCQSLFLKLIFIFFMVSFIVLSILGIKFTSTSYYPREKYIEQWKEVKGKLN